jgi:hypothetical protein
MEVSGQLHAPAALPQGKESYQYPSDRRLGGARSLSGHGVEEKNSQPPPGFEPRSSNRSARSQFLYRLRFTLDGGQAIRKKSICVTRKNKFLCFYILFSYSFFLCLLSCPSLPLLLYLLYFLFVISHLITFLYLAFYVRPFLLF